MTKVGKIRLIVRAMFLELSIVCWKRVLSIAVYKGLGVDSWAGDVFAALLNPAFILWPRLNFLGIKDGSHIVDPVAQPSLRGRSQREFITQAARVYPLIMQGILKEDPTVAEHLLSSGYTYLPS